MARIGLRGHEELFLYDLVAERPSGRKSHEFF
jgi:hypothetical protein